MFSLNSIARRNKFKFQSAYDGEVVDINAGYAHTVFAKADGTIFGCGDTQFNSIGTKSSQTTSGVASCVFTVPNFRSLMASTCYINPTAASCQIKLNQDLDFFNISKAASSYSDIKIDTTKENQIAAGFYNTLFIQNSTKFVWGCGNNSFLQTAPLNNNTPRVVATPRPIYINEATQLQAEAVDTFRHSLFLQENGTVLAAGLNSNGQLGAGHSGLDNGISRVGDFSESYSCVLNDITLDSFGNIYATTEFAHTILKITPDSEFANYTVTTIAGTPNAEGHLDDNGKKARFDTPNGIVADLSGNLFVCDTGNHVIRKITPNGTVTTFIGIPGRAGNSNIKNAVTFSSPKGIAINLFNGDLYIADTGNNLIRKYTASTQEVTTFCDSINLRAPRGIGIGPGGKIYVSNTESYRNSNKTSIGSWYSIDLVVSIPAAGGAAQSLTGSIIDGINSAAISGETTHLVCNDSEIYLAYRNAIRKVNPSDGTLTKFAGEVKSPGDVDGTNNISVSPVRFNEILCLALESTNNLYVSDKSRARPTSINKIKKVTISETNALAIETSLYAAKQVTSIAGDNISTINETRDGKGIATKSRFSFVESVATEPTDKILYIADTYNNTIRKLVLSTGEVTVVAGRPGYSGRTDNIGINARFNRPSGIAVNSTGTQLYVADTGNNSIRCINLTTGVVTTIAGSAGGAGFANGTGTNASFASPMDIVIDSTDTYLYVADSDNHAIRRITLSSSQVVTLAGTGTAGSANNTNSNFVEFFNPKGIAINTTDTFLFVADQNNHTIRRISLTNGATDTLAGTAGQAGLINQTGAAARFNLPARLAADSSDLYVSDTANNVIRKIVISTGATTTFATGNGSGENFDQPMGIKLDFAKNNLYVADSANKTIRKILKSNPSIVTTIAGTTGIYGSSNGSKGAGFLYPDGIARDSLGNLFITDSADHVIRKITVEGVVTTFAGSPSTAGSTNGTGSAARFNLPRGIAIDASDNLYVADSLNNIIRKITPSGVVTTLAGLANNSGSVDGMGTNARFRSPFGIVVNAYGDIYVTDWTDHTIRKIEPSGNVTTFAGTTETIGVTDGIGLAAKFNGPEGITTDFSRNLYVCDTGNHTIRKITPEGVVTTIAGIPGTSGRVDGTALGTAKFNYPTRIAIDLRGNIYVSEKGSYAIRKISSDGVVSSFAGQMGSIGYIDGTGSTARFRTGGDLTIDHNSNSLFVCDPGNRFIRKITLENPYTLTNVKAIATGGRHSLFLKKDGTVWSTGYRPYMSSIPSMSASEQTPPRVNFIPQQNTLYPEYCQGKMLYDSEGNLYDIRQFSIEKHFITGVTTRFAGSGVSGDVNDVGALASFASLNEGIACIDQYNNIYVLDRVDTTLKIKQITPDGTVRTIYIGSNNSVSGMDVDNKGNLYYTEQSTIRKIVIKTGTATVLAGSAGISANVNGTGSAARFSNNLGTLAYSKLDDCLYLADTGNKAIRKITTNGVVTTAITGGTDLFFYEVGVEGSNLLVYYRVQPSIGGTPGGVIGRIRVDEHSINDPLGPKITLIDLGDEAASNIPNFRTFRFLTIRNGNAIIRHQNFDRVLSIKGNGITMGGTVPLTGIASIAAGGDMSAFIDSSGTVWGQGYYLWHSGTAAQGIGGRQRTDCFTVSAANLPPIKTLSITKQPSYQISPRKGNNWWQGGNIRPMSSILFETPQTILCQGTDNKVYLLGNNMGASVSQLPNNTAIFFTPFMTTEQQGLNALVPGDIAMIPAPNLVNGSYLADTTTAYNTIGGNRAATPIFSDVASTTVKPKISVGGGHYSIVYDKNNIYKRQIYMIGLSRGFSRINFLKWPESSSVSTATKTDGDTALLIGQLDYGNTIHTAKETIGVVYVG